MNSLVIFFLLKFILDAERNDDEASIPSAIQIYTCRGLRNEQNSLIKALTEIGDQFYYILIYCLYYNKIF